MRREKELDKERFGYLIMVLGKRKRPLTNEGDLLHFMSMPRSMCFVIRHEGRENHVEEVEDNKRRYND